MQHLARIELVQEPRQFIIRDMLRPRRAIKASRDVVTCPICLESRSRQLIQAPEQRWIVSGHDTQRLQKAGASRLEVNAAPC